MSPHHHITTNLAQTRPRRGGAGHEEQGQRSHGDVRGGTSGVEGRGACAQNIKKEGA